MLLDELFQKARAGEIELDPFFITAQFPVATFIVGATIPINITINADSDYIIRNSMLVAYTAAPAFVVNPNYTCTIFDTGSGRNLQDQAVHVNAIFGNGQFPYVWPEPKQIKAASVLTVTLTNADTAAANVFVTFGGFKVFQVAKYTR